MFTFDVSPLKASDGSFREGNTAATGSTCTETASPSVSADSTACSAVTDLDDTTECSAVMTDADASIAACTYAGKASDASTRRRTEADADATTDTDTDTDTGTDDTTRNAALSSYAAVWKETMWWDLDANVVNGEYRGMAIPGGTSTKDDQLPITNAELLDQGFAVDGISTGTFLQFKIVADSDPLYEGVSNSVAHWQCPLLGRSMNEQV